MRIVQTRRKEAQMSIENRTENTVDNLTETVTENSAETAAAGMPAEKTEAALEKAAARPAKKQAGIGKLFGGGKKSSKSRADKGRNSEDDIRKLTRTELLELLIDETKEADRLKEENDRLREELAKCHEDLDRVASFEAVIARLEAIVKGR